MARGTQLAVETTERVLALVQTGKSYIDVAAEVGLTKNAISGIVNRAKQRGVVLQGMNSPGGTKRPVARKLPPIDRPPVRNKGVARSAPVRPAEPEPAKLAAAIARPIPPISPEPVATVVVHGAAAAILSLKARECRYPIGEVAAEDFRFCCAPVPAEASSIVKRPYCAEHRALISARPQAPVRGRSYAHG